jgi:acetyltransferase-like isoleucine patch superfamily enzyme
MGQFPTNQKSRRPFAFVRGRWNLLETPRRTRKMPRSLFDRQRTTMANLTPAQNLGLLQQRLRAAASWLWRLEARLKGVQIQDPVTFLGRPLVSVARNSHLVLGAGTQVGSSLRSTVLGAFQPCVLRTLEPGARLILGRGVGLSSTILCAGLSIEIGDHTIFGAGAMVLDNDFHVPEGECGWRSEHRENARPIRIGRGVFIGARAIVLKGVTLGDRAVVGAGAVVTKDVPAGFLAAGNPAKVFPPRPGRALASPEPRGTGKGRPS